MGKLIRISLITVGALIALLVAAIVALTLLIDPNDFKPEIEQAVSQNTRLELKLGGKLDWSLLPLGIELNDIQTTLDGRPFAGVNRLLAKVGLLSLIKLNPQVHTLEVDGLTLALVKNADGQGNWERIAKDSPALPAGATPAATPADAPVAASSAPATSETPATFNFAVEQILLANTGLTFSDEKTKQSLAISGLSATLRNITLGEFFPFELAVDVAVAQPKLSVANQLGGELRVSQDFKQFDVRGLQTKHTLAGEPFGGKSVEATLSGDISADLNKETAILAGFKVMFANLSMESDLNVHGFGANPTIGGKLTIPAFSLQTLLESLGQQRIVTADPNVLSKVGLAMELDGPAGTVGVKALTVTLDDTTLSGNASYGLEKGAIKSALKLSKMDLDRYLPPPADKPADDTAKAVVAAAATPGTTKIAPSSSGDEALLPLATLRGLDLDLSLTTSTLIASKLTLDELALRLTAKDGLIKLTNLDGKLYQGDFASTAQIDARTDNVTWKITEKVNNVQILPLLKDFAQVDKLEGGVNMTLDLTTSGNTVNRMKDAAKGLGTASIANGAFHGVNMSQLACEGIALAHQEKISTRNWPQKTDFRKLDTAIAIDGNTLRNTGLTAELGGLRLSGEGSVDLKKKALEYLAALQVVGDIEAAAKSGDEQTKNACRVNETVMNVSIPVKCSGGFADGDALACAFDKDRFNDTLVQIGKKKAGAKVEKAIDKKLDKLLGPDEPAVEGQAPSQKTELKNTLKGLFK